MAELGELVGKDAAKDGVKVSEDVLKTLVSKNLGHLVEGGVLKEGSEVIIKDQAELLAKTALESGGIKGATTAAGDAVGTLSRDSSDIVETASKNITEGSDKEAKGIMGWIKENPGKMLLVLGGLGVGAAMISQVGQKATGCVDQDGKMVKSKADDPKLTQADCATMKDSKGRPLQWQECDTTCAMAHAYTATGKTALGLTNAAVGTVEGTATFITTIEKYWWVLAVAIGLFAVYKIYDMTEGEGEGEIVMRKD